MSVVPTGAPVPYFAPPCTIAAILLLLSWETGARTVKQSHQFCQVRPDTSLSLTQVNCQPATTFSAAILSNYNFATMKFSSVGLAAGRATSRPLCNFTKFTGG